LKTLVRRFPRLPWDVKAKLFQALISIFMTLARGITFSQPVSKSLLLDMWNVWNFSLDFPSTAVSLAGMLLQLRLPSFDTVLHNARVSFCARLKNVSNELLDVLGLH